MMNSTPDSIFQVATGFMASKHLFIANEIGLFEQLAEGPTTLDELAHRTGIPRRTVRILADAMVALGFLDRQGDRYQNGSVAATFLSGQTPADLRPFLRFWNYISYPAWMQLEEAIRTGQGAVGYLDETDEKRSRIFSEGVQAITAGNAMALASTYDFSHHHRLLDLGGNTFQIGTRGMASANCLEPWGRTTMTTKSAKRSPGANGLGGGTVRFLGLYF